MTLSKKVGMNTHDGSSASTGRHSAAIWTSSGVSPERCTLMMSPTCTPIVYSTVSGSITGSGSPSARARGGHSPDTISI